MLLQLFSLQLSIGILLPLNSSSFQEFKIPTIWDRQRIIERKENVPQTFFQKLARTKRARAASRSIREISSASGSTYAPLPDFDVWSMPGNGWGLLLRRSNAGVVKSRQRWKGGPSSSATRRQSSLLTPQSRFSRCKDRSECQITARQRRQRRLFLLSLRRRLLLIN